MKSYRWLMFGLLALIFLGGGYAVYKLKEGVEIDGLQKEMRDGMNKAAAFFRDEGIGEMIVTAGTDGLHMPGSFHYKGRAIDIRLPSRIKAGANDSAITGQLQAHLGDDFDVVLESDHIHIEHDPMRGAA